MMYNLSLFFYSGPRNELSAQQYSSDSASWFEVPKSSCWQKLGCKGSYNESCDLCSL